MDPTFRSPYLDNPLLEDLEVGESVEFNNYIDQVIRLRRLVDTRVPFVQFVKF